MDRWQYFAHSIKSRGMLALEVDNQIVTAAMNHYANGGWEFINATSTVVKEGIRYVITLFFRRQ